jgi:hypothetical protein
VSPVRANPRAPTKPLDTPIEIARTENESFGEVSADIIVTVDIVTLIRVLGLRAVRNKAHTAQLLGGAVRVVAKHVREKEHYEKF